MIQISSFIQAPVIKTIAPALPNIRLNITIIIGVEPLHLPPQIPLPKPTLHLPHALPLHPTPQIPLLIQPHPHRRPVALPPQRFLAGVVARPLLVRYHLCRRLVELTPYEHQAAAISLHR